eukprot:3679660-Alexandrium_andersonii.AAC.1
MLAFVMSRGIGKRPAGGRALRKPRSARAERASSEELAPDACGKRSFTAATTFSPSAAGAPSRRSALIR